ncbi:hypothetical protein RA28_06385 [Ruegeria sp. ANG-S4]|nr:hypothetical protein RA28_06385 [Ruegeria sp. ANG-S4]
MGGAWRPLIVAYILITFGPGFGLVLRFFTLALKVMMVQLGQFATRSIEVPPGPAPISCR